MAKVHSMRCPVCGSIFDKSTNRSAECKICGFSVAYANWFANEADYRRWQSLAEEYRLHFWERIRQKFYGKPVLSFGDRVAACVFPEQQFFFSSRNDEVETTSNIIQASFSDRHGLYLFQDGHVEARQFSSGVYGQYNVSHWNGIQYVFAGPNCSYGVKTDGTVLVSGLPPVKRETIENWSSISSIIETESFVVGLTRQGRLSVLPTSRYDNESMRSFCRKVQTCSDIVSFSAAKNCIAVLDRNSAVHCFCLQPEDFRMGADSWTDVVALAVDSRCVVAVNRKGKVITAGYKPADSVKKRIDSVENAICVSSNQRGIGILTASGQVYFEGNIIGANVLQDEIGNNAEMIEAALVGSEYPL